MNNLSTYIIEKLHLDKHIKNTYLNEKDKVCFINLTQPGSYRREGCPVEVVVHDPMIIDEFNDAEHKITYYTPDKRKLETNYTEINKHGFIQDSSKNYCREIILNSEDAISLLKELYKSTKRVTLDILKDKYFEDIDSLDFKYWNKEIRFYTIISGCAVNLNRKIIQDLIDQYEADK
jgi:hypothetical protein